MSDDDDFFPCFGPLGFRVFGLSRSARGDSAGRGASQAPIRNRGFFCSTQAIGAGKGLTLRVALAFRLVGWLFPVQRSALGFPLIPYQSGVCGAGRRVEITGRFGQRSTVGAMSRCLVYSPAGLVVRFGCPWCCPGLVLLVVPPVLAVGQCSVIEAGSRRRLMPCFPLSSQN